MNKEQLDITLNRRIGFELKKLYLEQNIKTLKLELEYIENNKKEYREDYILGLMNTLEEEVETLSSMIKTELLQY